MVGGVFVCRPILPMHCLAGSYSISAEGCAKTVNIMVRITLTHSFTDQRISGFRDDALYKFTIDTDIDINHPL